MDIVDKLKKWIAEDNRLDMLHANVIEAISEIQCLRQHLAKPAPEAQILIDALRSIGDSKTGSNDKWAWTTARDALAAYDTKATPDNGVEK